MKVDDINTTEQESRWLQRAAWLTLIAGCCLSLGGWWHTSQTLAEEAQERLTLKAAQLAVTLQQFVDAHLHALDTFQAMFRSPHAVDRRHRSRR